MANRNSGAGAAHRVAMAGVFAAAAIVVMMLGGIIPIATFTAPAIAGVCVLPVALEAGRRSAWLCYATIAFVSFMVVADKELVLFFIFILGYYPIVYPKLTKIPKKPLQYLAKLLLFNAGVGIVYLLLLVVFTSPALLAEFREGALWFWALMLLVGNVTFFLYDILLGRLTMLYICKWKGKFIKK